jgi:hypothetical protein
MLLVPLGMALLLPSRARVELKRILLPSGDHAGSLLKAFIAASFVSGVGPEPVGVHHPDVCSEFRSGIAAV